MTDAPTDARTREFAVTTLPDRIAFLGLGLIGGSIAMALRDAGYRGTIAAWTPNGGGPTAAKRRSIIDEAAPTAEEALEGAGLVVLAGPPLAILDLLGQIAGPLRGSVGAETTITDVASTKSTIVENAAAYGLPFVGGHPMAGRETTGVASATADLFVDRPWVVVPGDDPRGTDIDRVWSLARATGANPMLLGAKEHDAAVAAISHLPLVLAAALVESVAGPTSSGIASWPTARELAATGWRDMTRLAKGDPEMGAGILTTNAGPITDRLRALRAVLDAWIDRLDPGMPGGGDPEWIRVDLERARAALGADESET